MVKLKDIVAAARGLDSDTVGKVLCSVGGWYLQVEWPHGTEWEFVCDTEEV